MKARELPGANVVTAWFYIVLAVLLAYIDVRLPPQVEFGLRIIENNLNVPGFAVTLSMLVMAWVMAEDRHPRGYVVWLLMDWLYISTVIVGVIWGGIGLLGWLAILYYMRASLISALMVYERVRRAQLAERVMITQKSRLQRIDYLEKQVERLTHE